MPQLSGLPYVEVQFTKEGRVNDPAEPAALHSLLATMGVTDLLVLAHGWNNDMPDARGLYRRFLKAVADVRSSTAPDPLAGRTTAVLGVLWPSKKFADKDLIPSGAASAGGAVPASELRRQIAGLRDLLDDQAATASLKKAERLVAGLEDSPKAQREFVDLIRGLLPPATAPDEDAAADLQKLPGDELMKRLSKPVMPAPPSSRPGTGQATALTSPAGSAAGVGHFFSGISSAARNLLNYATYYVMKERAGTVGATGVAPLLGEVRAANPDLRLHLVGHSFGGRLVSAAALGAPGQPAVKVQTLSLLQAAFSHYGFAQHWEGTKDGFFRRVVTEGRVVGPTVISYTKNDTAVGIAYPIASLITGQVAAALGDKNDKYGGIGRNGAQKTPEAVDGVMLAATGGSYSFIPGALYSLNADSFIKNHSDIAHPQVARAVLAAIDAA